MLAKHPSVMRLIVAMGVIVTWKKNAAPQKRVYKYLCNGLYIENQLHR